MTDIHKAIWKNESKDGQASISVHDFIKRVDAGDHSQPMIEEANGIIEALGGKTAFDYGTDPTLVLAYMIAMAATKGAT